MTAVTAITKTFEKDFSHLFNGHEMYSKALTLTSSAVTGIPDGAEVHLDVDRDKVYSYTHTDGWTISAKLHTDLFVWVNDFEAVHPKYGRVYGNFEKEVHADSEDGFNDFWLHHQPKAWDYGDLYPVLA